MPVKAGNFLAPLLERVRAGVDAVAAAVRTGTLRVDDELHLAPLVADDEDPEVTSYATVSINALARFNCQKSSWRWTPRCASAG